MKLWGGRFEGDTDAMAKAFGDSIFFDKALYRYDIEGSIAHATMLGATGILSEADTDAIVQGLRGILADLEAGTLTVDESCEDIHSFVETVLTERIGNPGKMLHTGRSRNDQVALDMRLYTRAEISEIRAALAGLLEVLLNLMKEHKATIMPGFTHLQKAQPVTLAHHLGAYFEMFRRDDERLRDCCRRMNYSPLGAGALAGTTYPLDREMTAELLGFDGATENSMDSVSDRDYLIELLSDLSLVMMHLSRFSEEFILWNSNEYRFITISDAYSTGSSIMPQKKNPDMAELIRGKTGRVYGALMSMLTVMKGIPLAYDKDMQEDKEVTFDAIRTAKMSLLIFTRMLATTTFHKDRMYQSTGGGFTNATDAADWLVAHGVPFRDAHGIIGRLVLYCQEQDKSLNALTLEEYRAIDPVFDETIYDAIDLENCVNRRLTKGAPSGPAMEQQIAAAERYIKERG